MSEPKIFEEWREEVRTAKRLLRPAAFLMSHDEMRVMNWCALCQSRKMTPGELLAENRHTQKAGSQRVTRRRETAKLVT